MGILTVAAIVGGAILVIFLIAGLGSVFKLAFKIVWLPVKVLVSILASVLALVVVIPLIVIGAPLLLIVGVLAIPVLIIGAVVFGSFALLA